MRHITAFQQAHPVAFLIVVVLVFFLIYEAMPPTVQRYSDLVMTAALAFAFSWAVVLMLRRTELWPVRVQGLLGVMAGDAFLYGAIGVGTWIGLRGHMIDMARACLAVGVVLFLIGLKRATTAPSPEVMDARDVRQNTREENQNDRELTQNRRDEVHP